jgi:hypothetical protein
MGSFIRGYADLTGFKIGNFTVDSLGGTDRNRAPLWSVTCSHCRLSQTFEHRTLCNALESGRPAEVLFCKDQRCPNSRRNVDESPSLFEIRQQEREKRRRAEREAAEAQASAERETAAAKARDAALAPLRAEWNEYTRQQINAGNALHEIAALTRWVELQSSLRERIMAAIRKDNSVKVTGLRR